MIASITLLLAVGSLQAPAPATPGQSGSAAGLHPSDAVVYFEIPDAQAVARSYTQSSYGRLLADQGFQTALGAVLGVESFDPLAELEHLYDGGVERGEMPPFRDLFLRPLRSLSLSISAKDGQLAPILRALESGALPEGAEGVPSFLRSHLGVEFALEFESRVAAQDYSAFMLALLEGQGAERDDQTLELADGRELLLTTIDTGVQELPTLRFFQAGSRVVLLSGMHSTEACVERLGGKASGLASGPGLSAGAKHFGEREGTVVFEGFSSVGEQLVSSLDLPDFGPVIDVLEGLFGPLVTMVTRGGHWRVQLVEGRFVTEGFHAIPANGPLDGLFSSAPLSDDAYALVHPEAIVGWIAHLDRDALSTVLAQIAPSSGAMDEIEQTYEFRPDRDLVEPLGSAVAWSLPPVRSLLAAPPFMLTIGLHDAPAFTRGMDGVFALLAKEAAGEIAVSETRYRDIPMYTVQFTGELDLDLGDFPIDPMGFFKPTVAVLPDRVILTTLQSHAKREIRRLIKGEAEPHPLLATGRFPEGASEVGFADWVSFIGKIYDGLVPLASMAEELMGPIPVDLASLPKSDVFTGFFEPATRWEQRMEDGVFHHAESSFGPEVPFAVALGALGGVMWTRLSSAAPASEPFVFEVMTDEEDGGGLVSAATEPPRAQGDLEALSIARMSTVRVAITVYQLDTGKLPKDLPELTKPTSNYPRGFLDGKPIPLDGWDRPLRYEASADAYKLWSIGPDGVDQGGLEDDILGG